MSTVNKALATEAGQTAIKNALDAIGATNIGNMSALSTTDKTSLVGAVNEVAGDVSDLDTAKADKVSGATNGNLASLDSSGNLADAGWASDKTTASVSGNPISISELKSNQLAIDPIITFEPIQAGSGTPSPSNVRAISGYDKVEVLSCGVNVWDETWEVGAINGSTGEPISFSNRIRSKNFNRCIGGASYYGYIGFNVSLRIAWYDIARNFIEAPTTTGGIVTAPANACYFKLTTEGTTYGETYRNDIGLNYPATQTSYVPYNKATSISESLGQTVYGGTLDLRNGKLTVKYKKIDLSSLSWSYQSDFGVYYSATPSDLKTPLNNTDVPNALCSKYEVTSRDGMAQNYQLSIQPSSASNQRIYVIETSQPSGDLCYELADSAKFTIQLTPHEIPLLKDYAYMSTNGTNIAFDYHNGEMASLADVSQLGETVNNLLNNQTAIISVSQDISYLAREHCLKIGNIINLSCEATGTFTNGSYTNIGTIAYKPINNMWFPLINAVSGALAGTVLLTSEGLIRALPSANGLTKVAINLMFITNQ